MTVTDFVMVLWNNKIKVMLLILAFAFGPGLFDDWQQRQAEERLDADRRSVDHDASVAGMMLMNAWRDCRDIGIVNDMERCATYEGKLIQEQSAPILAKMAIEHRDAYYKNCLRFHQQEYCGQLLQRSVALSNAQSESKD
ncbi:hypothetical protein Q5W_21835 [Hydrogenophaga sp. PBC]|uniref:hypothetical protein n=1 Tax=Hydrogenophaga sp. PBC TaxID=795665 RepID=UPI0002607A3A|nr:hypothetical protein [Hydrogenophaga sp. PBC]AOS81404.1 hypothetical protein Q5W_21835 [Hydrogenophaga sp. PBC]